MNLRARAHQHKIKGILTINVLSLFLNSFACALTPGEIALQKAQAPITYAEIGEQLLASYGIVSNAPTTPQELSLDQKLNPTVKEISDQEKLQKLYDILRQQEIQNPSAIPMLPKNNRATRTVIKDLEVYHSSDAANHANHTFSRINRTQTCFGQAELAAWLTQPTTDITVLQNRQQAIQALINDESLMNECSALVAQAERATSIMFSNWIAENETTKFLIDSFYIKKYEKNPAALEAYTRLSNLGLATAMFFNLPAIPQLFGYWAGSNVAAAIAEAFGQKADAPSLSELGKEIKQLPKEYVAFMKQLRSVDTPKAKYIAVAAAHALAAAYILYSLSQIKAIFQATQIYNNIANYVHTKLIGMGTLVRNTHKIHSIAEKHPALADSLMYKDFNTGSADYMRLNKMLQTNTFKGQASFFSLTGKVFAAHALMNECRNEFTKYMKAIGEIDALLSLAILMKEFEGKPNGLTFVRYVQQDTPYINLTGFWNPLVNPETAVANNLELGSLDGNPGYTCNIILTGANTGGKSTALKAILTDIFLAQTCGIAFAKDLVMTPFAYVNSSLNIVDNTAGGKSQGQAEADRVAMLINDAHTLKTDEKALIVGDELFRGLSAEAANEETYKCIQRLIDCPNTVSLIATHTKRATNLEQETNGMSKNYRMEAIIHEDSSITTPYILEPGINRYDIASNIVGNAIAQAA
ncbi:MAG TPA: hypothetical protein VGT41_00775 [Candidatus Babeliales bacterium]|nr:hypothetical protein [Candidatus Babeliales bacterium]